MRILMIAPQPFFEPRGAPLCVYQHIKALLALGYQVDLVTYPFGNQVQLPNLTIYRAPALPFIRSVKPGLSLAKFPLDLLVFFTAFSRLCLTRYRYLHTHEEAALMGIPLAAVFGCKHLYYMHCNLAQIVSEHPLIVRCVQVVQRIMVRSADAVVAFYPEIALTARRMAPGKPVYLVTPPAVDEAVQPAQEDEVIHMQRMWNLGEGPLLLYTGTLEAYQGLDILLRSVARVRKVFPNATYLIVGGKAEQVKQFQHHARRLGVADGVRFIGQRPLEEMPHYMALATVLLSPRSKGTHTPLKLYTYLRSGKPILATNILSHTQVLTSEIAMLVPPTPEGLAEGVLELLLHPRQAQALGECGQRFAAEQYSWPIFLEKNRQLYDAFAPLAG